MTPLIGVGLVVLSLVIGIGAWLWIGSKRDDDPFRDENGWFT